MWDHPRLEESDEAVLVTLAYAGRARRMPEIAGPFEGEPGIRAW